MSRWTVVRVAAYDGQLAQRDLVDALAPITMTIDTRPPAAGPEWEIAVQDYTESDVRAVLGNMILATKTVLDSPLERASVRTEWDRATHDELAPPPRGKSAYHNPPRPA